MGKDLEVIDNKANKVVDKAVNKDSEVIINKAVDKEVNKKVDKDSEVIINKAVDKEVNKKVDKDSEVINDKEVNKEVMASEVAVHMMVAAVEIIKSFLIVLLLYVITYYSIQLNIILLNK